MVYDVVCAKSLQSCPTLCNPMGCSLPGSSVHGILQERILEWVAMPSSRGSSGLTDRTHVPYASSIGKQVLYHYTDHLGSICWQASSLPLSHQGSPPMGSIYITKSLCHTPETNTTL